MATSKELSGNDNGEIEAGKIYDCLISGFSIYVSPEGRESLNMNIKTSTGAKFRESIATDRPDLYWKIGRVYSTLGLDDLEVGNGFDPDIHNENLKGYLISAKFEKRKYKEKEYTQVKEWITIPESREDEVASMFNPDIPF